MALQDGLLSFAIKETIFLSPDKAGIGELQELELVPDVEVLENQSYVSITGCLQLYGKYEPIRDTAETNSGGTETLVEAMTFSPFRPENTDGPFYGWEEQIGHRIPLNITIPLDRIAEIGDIYAVVDSFDYKLESPHQLLIEAELKIAGIVIGEQPQDAQHQPDSPASPEYGQTEPGRQEEAWDFAYAVNDQPKAMAEPASLDEIEQKLYELEREMDRQAQPVNYESADSAALYDVPALSVSTGQAFGDQRFGEVSEEEEPVTQATFSEQAEAVEQESPWETQSVSYGTQSAEYESSSVSFETESAFTQTQESEESQGTPDFQHTSDTQWNGGSEPSQPEQAEEPVLAIHDEQEAGYTPIAQEEPEAVEEAAEIASEIAEDAEGAEEIEVRVAISGKPSREEEGNLNITSIFSQATRARQEAQVLAAESSSSSSLKGAAAVNSATVEAMQNLTSFVRNKEERSSQLKMCIIQRNETLELISQRYSLPVSKILEVNRLTSDQLVAGQILYIPQ